ncbi:predicted protein [Naegleria gruberi]|uniref:Predicted protein n=1 Tax=Naegleria gruberi TaxID=5762 RepID=D2VDH6_NAEGR|nr:uncharacterized protein NAEGRDRAFT_48615 [Naegleria gruberi]EFC45142.1 predicted protein [Naegleria gruberi]|eukprot:XP_002677886.1 predicted protein [Naegleria gruberi strain NEG-M]
MKQPFTQLAHSIVNQSFSSTWNMSKITKKNARRLSLINHNPSLQLNDALFEKFKIHMRSYRNCVPFSMKFEEMNNIKSIEHKLHCPSQAKISHSHNCLCISDNLDSELKFFDLITHEYLGGFLVEGVTGLLIEENFDDQQNDAIYFGKNKYTFKYRVKDLMRLGSSADCIWKIERNHMYGMAIRTIGNQKQLFRYSASQGVMDIIDTVNGKVIKELKLEKLDRVMDIIFINPKRMLVAELFHNACFIYDEMNENEWKLIQTIEKAENIYFSQPLGLAIDRTGGKIFLSDYDIKRIVVFNESLDLIDCHYPESLNPFRLDFDETTGLLYITDQQDDSIRIFK